MDDIVAVGAVARVDPDPRKELAAWEEDLDVGRIDDPDEIRRRLDAQARGEQLIVRLDLFAEVKRGDRVARVDGAHVSGVWFEVGAHEANDAHAREMVAAYLDRLYEDLTVDHGMDVAYDRLWDAPVRIELDHGVARRVAGG